MREVFSETPPCSGGKPAGRLEGNSSTKASNPIEGRVEANFDDYGEKSKPKNSLRERLAVVTKNYNKQKIMLFKENRKMDYEEKKRWDTIKLKHIQKVFEDENATEDDINLAVETGEKIENKTEKGRKETEVRKKSAVEQESLKSAPAQGSQQGGDSTMLVQNSSTYLASSCPPPHPPSNQQQYISFVQATNGNQWQAQSNQIGSHW